MKKYFYAFCALLFCSQGMVQAQATCTGDPNPGTIRVADSLPCMGDSVDLHLHGLTETGLGFQWQVSDDGMTFFSIGGATDSTYSDTITHTTWYRCAVTCISSGNTVYGTARKIVVATTAPSGGSISASHTGDTYHFNVTGMSSGVYSYSWSFGDGVTATAPVATHTYTEDGTYVVRVIIRNGCGYDSLGYNLSILTGIAALTSENGVHIYPNPVNDGFNLISSKYKQIDHIRITDMSGRVYWTQNTPLSLPAYISAQNLRLGPGTYFVELGAGEEKGFIRMVVQ